MARFSGVNPSTATSTVGANTPEPSVYGEDPSPNATQITQTTHLLDEAIDRLEYPKRCIHDVSTVDLLKNCRTLITSPSTGIEPSIRLPDSSYMLTRGKARRPWRAALEMTSDNGVSRLTEAGGRYMDSLVSGNKGDRSAETIATEGLDALMGRIANGDQQKMELFQLQAFFSNLPEALTPQGHTASGLSSRFISKHEGLQSSWNDLRSFLKKAQAAGAPSSEIAVPKIDLCLPVQSSSARGAADIENVWAKEEAIIAEITSLANLAHALKGSKAMRVATPEECYECY